MRLKRKLVGAVALALLFALPASAQARENTEQELRTVISEVSLHEEHRIKPSNPNCNPETEAECLEAGERWTECIQSELKGAVSHEALWTYGEGDGIGAGRLHLMAEHTEGPFLLDHVGSGQVAMERWEDGEAAIEDAEFSLGGVYEGRRVTTVTELEEGKWRATAAWQNILPKNSIPGHFEIEVNAPPEGNIHFALASIGAIAGNTGCN